MQTLIKIIVRAQTYKTFRIFSTTQRMGSCSSHLIADFNYDTIAKNYTYKKTLIDSRFGEIRLLKHRKTNAMIFQKDYASNSSTASDRYLELIYSLAKQPHASVLNIVGYTARRDDAFCSKSYIASIFYEAFETDLEVQLNKRILRKVNFLSLLRKIFSLY